jgi:ribonuclease HI
MLDSQIFNITIRTNSISELEMQISQRVMELNKISKIETKKYDLIVISNSENFKKIFTQYILQWKKNDWRTSKKTDVANKIEIEKIETYLHRFHSYKFIIESVKKDKEANINARIAKHTDYHFSIKGSVYNVNFYPTKKTFYINGTNAIDKKICTYQTVEELIDIADGKKNFLNSLSFEKSKRKNFKQCKTQLFQSIKSCFWCNVELSLETATIEHKIPLSKGGSNRNDNLTLACFECNSQRKNKTTKL